jgi:hypothetical protein
MLNKEDGATAVHDYDVYARKESGAFDIDLTMTTSDGRSTWTYTITRDKPKNHDYLILDFGTCGEESASINNIVSVTVNGADWSDKIANTESDDCYDVPSANVVKFYDLKKADKHIIEFTLDTIYAPVSTTAWMTTGKACGVQTVTGPGCRGYSLTTTMEADATLTGKSHAEVNTYMKTFGYDYAEHPYCNGGYGGHADGIHVNVIDDAILNKPVFGFDIHIDPVIDGDRCSSTVVDRQRNEMKSVTNNTTWAKVQGNWNEWQILEWKFKLPVGFQPTSNFCHIHQLKAQDGPNNGNPVITITPRANSDGSNKRIQIIHTIDGATTDKGTMVNNIPLSDFEGEWVQVSEEMHFTHSGYYSCKITRVRDGKVLIDFKDTNIDMWPSGSSYVRHKYGLYRSLSGGRLDRIPVGQSPLLRNESILIDDFKVYEKNTNQAPAVPHD